jgi:hypothetical protein
MLTDIDDPGAKTLTATYSGDGNFLGSSGSATHNVQYAFTGFFAPVDNVPVVNKANAGQAIPVKWRSLTPTAWAFRIRTASSR